jgi:ABC-type transport system involved in multi-copper enzyme maturation permease subunit
MAHIGKFILFEIKRVCRIRIIIVVLLLLCLSILFLQNGIVQYKNTINKKNNFQEIEKIKTSRYINYRVYGVYGIRMLFVPAPISIFFVNSCVIPDMASFVDSGERLKIYNPLKGRNIFDLKKSGLADFSGIIFFFFTLMALIYGYDSFFREDYLKFLSSLSNDKMVFLFIFVSRILIVFLLTILFLASTFLLILINGLSFTINQHLFYFTLLIFLLSIFFYSLGNLFNRVRSKIVGIISMLSCWFILIFLIPTAVNSYSAQRANDITPLYNLELNKFRIFSNFEEQAMRKEGPFKYEKKITERIQKMMLDYLKNQFKEIVALEDKMQEEMKENINLFQTLSIAFPTTFYQSVTNELSSRGYDNLLVFYKYVQEFKRKFVRFYMDKVYFSNFSEVEPFVKEEENVYNAKPGLPVNFHWGILVTLGWIALFTALSYYNFKKILYKEPDKKFPYPDQKPIKLEGPGYTVLKVLGIDIPRRVYNLLSGKRGKKSVKGFTNKLYIDNTDIAEGPGKFDFAYICQPEAIPGDIKVKDLLTLVFRLSGFPKAERSPFLENAGISAYLKQTFNQLELDEKSRVLLSVLAILTKDILVINNLCRGVPEDVFASFDKELRELASGGAKILYLTSQTVPEKLPKGQGFLDDTDVWNGRMEKHRDDPDD